MAGLVPAIHVLLLKAQRKTWMPGTRPGMTTIYRPALLLGIKPEMHDVAIGDDVLLAFQPQLAGIAGAGFAAERGVIGIGDGFGADKSLFEIGMDHAGRGRRLGAAVDGPGPRLLRPDGEIGDEVE